MIDIVVERDTANDECASVAAILVETGAVVAADELLFEIEDSKAIQEVRAAVAGVLVHSLTVGQEVPYGEAIAQIRPEGEADAASVAVAEVVAPVAEVPVLEPVGGAAPVRFSRAAEKLAEQLGVPLSLFPSGFVTSEAVRQAAGVDLKPIQAPRPAIVVEPTAGTPVPGHKRAEIEALSTGAAAGTLSVLGVTLGPLAVARPAGDLFAGKITDLVIYEASRLMRKFPRLNAAYAKGRVVRHDAVHAGLAIDGGQRLVVYGIQNADRMTLAEIGAAVGDAAARYLSRELTSAEMTRATFTITDLSASPVDFVLPLLPAGQSCIVGVTKGQAGFGLFAGFDHRVSEGAEVAQFLSALAERVRSFADPDAPTEGEPECAYCGRSATQAVRRFNEKGLLAIVGAGGERSYCCASCWNGW